MQPRPFLRDLVVWPAFSPSSPCRVRRDLLPRGSRRTFRLGCGPMSAKAKVKSHQWFCRGRARFTCKKRAKARSKIPATSPWTLRAPARALVGRRFYVICEADQIVSRDSVRSRQRSRFERHREFRKRNTVREELQQCDGFQTDDRRSLCDGRGDHVFQRLLSRSAGKDVALIRSFVQFDGEGDTANARQRAIGGHPAVLLRGVCRRKDPDSPYADQDGYVPFGKLVDYSDGRSNGCTSWSRVGRRANHPDDEGQADDALHLS